MAVFGCNRNADSAKSDPAKTDIAVEVVAPEKRSLPRVVEQPGTIQAYEETHLFARVPGYVRLARDGQGRILSDIGKRIRGPKLDGEGKEIEAGEVLAELAAPELEEEVKQKKSLIRQADAEVDQMRKALTSAAASIAAADSAVVEAKALLAQRESESKRIADLVKNGVLDAQARDEAQNQFKAAGARVVTAQAVVDKAKADRDKAAADLTAAQARVDVTIADARRSEAMFGYAKIRAPYDGIITARRANTGDFVSPTGAKGEWLFTVARLEPARIVINIPEVDAALIDLDKADVTLTVPALSGLALTGPFKLTRTSWALDPGARTLRAEIDLPNKEARLRPGMYVYAKLSIPVAERWTLPASAVVKQGEGLFAFQIEPSGKAVRRAVQAGRTDGIHFEILRIRNGDLPSNWEEFSGNGDFALRAAGLADGQIVRTTKADR